MFERLSITTHFRPRAIMLGVVVVFVLAALIPQITYAQSAVATVVEQFLWMVVNVLFGWLVWFGGMLLDYAINSFVIGFGAMYGTSGLGATIDRLWVVVRDLFNLTFIFGLVFIGLRMIFDSSNSSTRKMLINLILAALLVNFSLFITKFVIDFANIAATQLATAFQVGGTGPANVSGTFMNLMGLSSILKASGSFAQMQGGSGMGYILGTMILYIISAFVFLGGAILLIIRFVVLNIYMVLSPLMFLGWVFPSMSSVSSQYWKGFLGRAFFAPAYLLMLYFAQSVLTTFAITRVGGGNNGLASIFGTAAPTSFAQVVPPFVLTAVFLIASLVVAQKMGANGADGVMKAGNMLSGKAKQYTKQTAGAATFGAAAAVGRTTIGQAASRFSQSKSLNQWAAKDKFFLGKAALGATRKVADSSFDARQVGGLGKNLGIGTGRKGGYSTIVKERTKADAEFAKSLKEGDTSKDEKTKEYNDADTKKFVENYKAGNADYQAKLADVTATAAAKSAADAAMATKRSEVAAEKARLEAEIAEADKSAIPAVKATAERKKQELAKYQSESNAELQNLEAVSRQASAAAAKAKEVEEKLLKTVIGQAEAMVKYANQLTFIETRENESKWRSKTPFRLGSTVTGNILGGGAAGLAGAGAAAGMAATGGAGILGYSILAGGADIRNQSVEALRKTYGKDGTNMVKAKKEKEKMQTLQEVLKENTEPEPKKEEAE